MSLPKAGLRSALFPGEVPTKAAALCTLWNCLGVGCLRDKTVCSSPTSENKEKRWKYKVHEKVQPRTLKTKFGLLLHLLK